MKTYTPRISAVSLCRLRRLSWAAGSPMTKTLDRLIELVCSRINAQAVCNACLDGSKCDVCGLAQRCKAAKKPSIQLSELVAEASAVKSKQTLLN
jgi:hypothetical protein